MSKDAEKTEVVWRWEYVNGSWLQVPEERSGELSLSERMKEAEL